MFEVPFSVEALNLFTGSVFIKYLQHWKRKIFTTTKRKFSKNWVLWSIRHTSNISKNKIKCFELKYFVKEGNLMLIFGNRRSYMNTGYKNCINHRLI